MFRVTDSAGQYLGRLLRGQSREKSARLEQVADGWRVRLDKQNQGDVAFAHEGRTVLLVEDIIAGELDGATLDVKRDKGQAMLTLH